MVSIPWPLSNTPGLKPQEGAGRLINVWVEDRGEGQGPVWRRVPGAAVFSREPSVMAAVATSIAAFFSSVIEASFEAEGDAVAGMVGDFIQVVAFDADMSADGHATADLASDLIANAAMDAIADSEAEFVGEDGS